LRLHSRLRVGADGGGTPALSRQTGATIVAYDRAGVGEGDLPDTALRCPWGAGRILARSPTAQARSLGGGPGALVWRAVDSGARLPATRCRAWAAVRGPDGARVHRRAGRRRGPRAPSLASLCSPPH